MNHLRKQQKFLAQSNSHPTKHIRKIWGQYSMNLNYSGEKHYLDTKIYLEEILIIKHFYKRKCKSLNKAFEIYDNSL